MSELTIPRFLNWTKPATVTEALERCLEHARHEEKWASGSWFETDLSLKIMEDWETGEMYVDEQSHARVAEAIEGQTCTDVKACSAGIVAIEVLDGEALYDYLRREEEMDQNLLEQDPIARGALGFLSQGFRHEFSEEESYGSPADPISCIVYFNDKTVAGREERLAHHARIVRSFEKGLELSRAADAAKEA